MASLREGPPDLEPYRSAREFEHAAGLFSLSLPLRKMDSISALRRHAAELSASVLACVNAQSAEEFEQSVQTGLRSRKECFELIDYFVIIKTGKHPLRTAALELLERAHAQLLGLSAKAL